MAEQSFEDIQAKYEALQERHEKVEKELKEFAYIVSHDLKAPLRGIKTLVNWIADDYADKLDDDGREQMDLLNNRVDRMHSLIEGVLQYSRIGRMKEDIETIDLQGLLSEVLEGLNVPDHVTVTIDPNLPILWGEKTRVTQLFQHVLDNAVKFMDKEHGQVELTCTSFNDDFWQFSVSDNGPGVREEHFERVFRMFQTLVPRDEFESTGVGLTLVKKIVELVGGRVWLESEVGKGCVFHVTYPKTMAADPDVLEEENPAESTTPACAV